MSRLKLALRASLVALIAFLLAFGVCRLLDLILSP